ncbi:MAG TPA: S8 family serine peptidase [Vicinamibacterales bacterium]|nr:S8 family serine peptidase [Vicinamibacterales bacterium]
MICRSTTTDARGWRSTLLPLAAIFLALAITGTGQTISAGGAVIGETLQARLTDAAPTDTLQVIVTFRGTGAPTAQQLEALASLGVSGVHLRSFPIAGVVATPGQIDRIAALPGVRSIYHNDPLAYENEGGTTITGVRKLRADPALGYTGTGVTVLVNDSGIDGTHEDLKYPNHVIQNVYAGANLAAHNGTAGSTTCMLGACTGKILPVTWVEDVPNTDFSTSHGTHVAGIVGGSGARSDGKYTGVAPGARLIGYGSGAALFVLDALGGFDYAKAQWATYGIRVITNSFGSPGDINRAFDPEHPVNVVTQELAEDLGIIVVFSAGNSGGENAITGVYKKAPWVIVVANGTKQGRIAATSSRGQIGFSGTYTDPRRGVTYQLTDRPTVMAPGTAIVSVRALSADPLPAADSTAGIAPQHLPFYTIKSGTSMAAPHVAGVIALMLEANPSLGWRDVKAILEKTATNVGDLADWETGAGYLNAYGAVAMAAAQRPGSAVRNQDYGSTNRLHRVFNARAEMRTEGAQSFTITYTPLDNPVTGTNSATFEVGPKATLVLASGDVGGPTGAGPSQLLRVALEDPDGQLYSPGVPIPGGALSGYRIVVAPAKAGTWKVMVRGTCGLSGTVTVSVCTDDVDTNGLAVPTVVDVHVKTIATESFAGLDDVAAHPWRGFIEAAVARQLVDGRADGNFHPDAPLTRIELAEYLALNPGVRQFLPLSGVPSFSDVAPAQLPFAEAAAARGGILRDPNLAARAAMEVAPGLFSPAGEATRLQVAYSLVQTLGLEQTAAAHAGGVTYLHDEEFVTATDLDRVPPDLYGYIQLALDLRLFTLKIQNVGQDRLKVRFQPGRGVTRAEYARAAVMAADFYAPRQP